MNRSGAPSSLLRAVRPKQWMKNVLVAAAPLAGGVLFAWHSIGPVLVAFLAFCLASSAGYLLNDVLDIDSDRHHPTKCRRPIAAGEVSVRLAISTAVVLALASLAVSLLARPQLTLVVAIYLLVTASYSFGVKNEAVFDLAIVTSGFLLRAIAGGVAVNVPLSQWFLLVTSFGSLFMVTGKRYAEVHRRDLAALAGDPLPASSRPAYTASYLRFVFAVSAAATIVFYALWSVVVGGGDQQVWAEISVAPLVLGILRYGVDVDNGTAGAPEDVVLRDRGLQLIGLVWLIVFWVAVHVG